MVRDSNKKNKNPKDSPFKKFVKKRAPIYLGIIALIIVFAVPELTQGNLQSIIPDTLTEKEREVFDMLMSYRGSNEKGLSIMDAIANKIKEEYPNEKIFDNKKTSLDVKITSIDTSNYQVIFNFKSYKGEINYDWNVDIRTGKVLGNNPESKHIVDLVDYYD